MKITKSQLRKMIKEELLKEGPNWEANDEAMVPAAEIIGRRLVGRQTWPRWSVPSHGPRDVLPRGLLSRHPDPRRSARRAVGSYWCSGREI